MTPAEEKQRAEHARQLMDDPLVKEALSDIKQVVLEQWVSSPSKDRDLRDYLHCLYCAVSKFEELLRIHVESGKVAQHNLDLSRYTP